MARRRAQANHSRNPPDGPERGLCGGRAVADLDRLRGSYRHPWFVRQPHARLSRKAGARKFGCEHPQWLAGEPRRITRVTRPMGPRGAFAEAGLSPTWTDFAVPTGTPGLCDSLMRGCRVKPEPANL